ncbi:MAG TPA: hypothetical protein VNE17_04310 [Nitrolancea sp.]|nr:hypothetical protein [Nitrolancea sp.]
MQPEDVIGGPREFTFAVGQLPLSDGETATPESDVERQPIADLPVDNFSSLPEMVRNVARGPGDAGTPPPRFEPSQLRRVIPVVQRQEVEQFAITMLSLEVYTDGFSAIVRIDYPEAPVHLPHTFHWQAEDDLGSRYWPRGAAGSGGVIHGKTSSWRLDCPFIPALDPSARELRMRLDDVEFGKTPHGRLEPETLVSITGRWEFVVSF